MNTSVTCVEGFISGINFSSPIHLEDLCNTVQSIADVIDIILLNIVLISQLVLIIISIFGQIRESYKWLVCHSSCCFLFNVLLVEAYYFRLENIRFHGAIPGFSYIIL
jgi:hypothetical protein